MKRPSSASKQTRTKHRLFAISLLLTCLQAALTEMVLATTDGVSDAVNPAFPPNPPTSSGEDYIYYHYKFAGGAAGGVMCPGLSIAMRCYAGSVRKALPCFTLTFARSGKAARTPFIVGHTFGCAPKATRMTVQTRVHSLVTATNCRVIPTLALGGPSYTRTQRIATFRFVITMIKKLATTLCARILQTAA